MYPPERIKSDIAQGRLRLHRAGTVVVFDHATLRGACRHVECQFRHHHGAPINVPVAVHVTTTAPVDYGVQLIFSDGYVRGVYLRAYLTEFATTAAVG